MIYSVNVFGKRLLEWNICLMWGNFRKNGCCLLEIAKQIPTGNSQISGVNDCSYQLKRDKLFVFWLWKEAWMMRSDPFPPDQITYYASSPEFFKTHFQHTLFSTFLSLKVRDAYYTQKLNINFLTIYITFVFHIVLIPLGKLWSSYFLSSYELIGE